jgi:myo-inositol-1(or 4)-monophosphatase
MPVLLEALAAGGDVVRGYFAAGVRMRSKAPADLVSDADVQAEQAIVEVIRRACPADEVLGEESHRGDAQAERLWVVDPLDGTTNFAHQLPHFAVSIAFYRNGQAEAAGVLNPIRDDLYTAVRGGGAFHNGQPIHCGEQERLNEVLIGCGFYYDRGQMMRSTLATLQDFFERGVHGVRRWGTASLDLCQVASGAFGAFFEYQLSPWDFAAGALIVQEAGGRVATCTGAGLPLQPTSVLAASGALFEPALEIVSRRAP